MKYFATLLLSAFIMVSTTVSAENSPSLKITSILVKDISGKKAEATSSVDNFILELGNEILGRHSLHADYRALPFKRALLETREGTFDGIIGIYKTSDRESYLAYSDPIYSVDIKIYSGTDAGLDFRSVVDLAGLRIGYLRGAANGKAFHDSQLFHKIDVTDKATLPLLLSSGRIDAYVDAEHSAREVLEKLYPELKIRIREHNQPLITRNIHMAFSRKHSNAGQLVRKFNAALRSAREDGSIAAILDRHKVNWRKGPGPGLPETTKTNGRSLSDQKALPSAPLQAAIPAYPVRN